MKELLRIKDFSVFYTDNIVDNVSFSLNKGDMIGLIGRNGCGKSRLLKGIMGSLKTSGDVLFC
ncbi:MAG: ATP-binding cassette domain-containing protein, partial [Thomasclavelia sp.]|uniref:ATP-binding cassette domain-containing protein n=1 Tax=Thomasclavelia sp. TaxID=3025757 RepID=UPI0039A39087